MEKTKLQLITQLAKENPNLKFTSLAHLLGEDFLKESYWELKRNKAPGIDGRTVEEYGSGLEDNIRDLVERLKAKRYEPQPAKRVYIEKDNGSKRPLGMLVVEDKVVQMGIKKILEVIYEEDFMDVSYGFRPKRNCHGAIEVIDKAIMTKPTNWVVDMDIEKCFDTIDHTKLMECLQIRIKDTSLLRIINLFLKAGIMEEGEYIETEEGTPQGGILSPLLANIYLHYLLDKWFEKKVKKEKKGYAQMVRYADDFLVCFEKEKDARTFVEELRERLSKGNLKIAEAKARIIEFGRKAWEKAKAEGKRVETFDFLGFTHYCDKTLKGKFKLGRKTAKKKLKQKIKKMKEWLRKHRNAIKEKYILRIIKAKLIGHYRYYGISGNSQGITEYYSLIRKLLYKWLNRRSQRKSYTWERFDHITKSHLPKPKIYHHTYTLSMN